MAREGVGKLECEVMETKWPASGPDFNRWQTNLAEFMAALEKAKHSGFWCADMDLKYLTIRIDTRDNGWLLYIDSRKDGGEKTRIDPQRVIDAICKWNEVAGDSKPYAPLAQVAK